jgi:uncharacterized protein DUF5681
LQILQGDEPMAAKKTKPTKKAKKPAATKKAPADKQRKNSGKKLFAKGNPYAFKPGQSGNPAGRPKSRPLSEAYRALLSQPLKDDPTRTVADVVAAAMVQNAFAGDVAAAKELADRTEGKAKQGIDLTVGERVSGPLELAIERLIKTGLSEDQAKEYLAQFLPAGVKEWIH